MSQNEQNWKKCKNRDSNVPAEMSWNRRSVCEAYFKNYQEEMRGCVLGIILAYGSGQAGKSQVGLTRITNHETKEFESCLQGN